MPYVFAKHEKAMKILNAKIFCQPGFDTFELIQKSRENSEGVNVQKKFSLETLENINYSENFCTISFIGIMFEIILVAIGVFDITEGNHCLS